MDDQPIQLVIQHFALPKYRVPVFRELANVPGIDLTLVYGKAPGLTNVDADGLNATASKVRRWRTPLGSVHWDSSQWAHASGRVADVLILSWNLRSISLVPALVRARRRGVRTLLWGHGYSRHASRWRGRARNAVARLADGVVLNSKRDAERFVAATGRGTSTFVAVNSLDQAPIQRERTAWLADGDGLAEFRREHGRGRGPTVLFVSRFKVENRLEMLIEAAALLRSSHPGLAVWLVGEGIGDQTELRALVDGLDLSEVVQFVGPVYDEHALAPWFLTADVFCYPSNLGLSVLHAFGYGVPVVTGDREDRNPPEWHTVESGTNGLLFAAGSVTELAGALDTLFKDEALRRRYGEAGRQRVLTNYSVEHMVAGLKEAVLYASRL